MSFQLKTIVCYTGLNNENIDVTHSKKYLNNRVKVNFAITISYNSYLHDKRNSDNNINVSYESYLEILF